MAISAAALVLGVSVPAEAASGNFDPSFGVAGRVVTDFGGNDAAATMLPLPDGSILAAGSSAITSGGLAQWDVAPPYGLLAIAKYTPTGALDTTWGTGGRVTTDVGIPAVATDLALQPDGRIVVAGSVYECCDRFHFLARYNADGTLDASLGSGGFVTFHLVPPFGSDDDPSRPLTAVALRTDGKILVAATAQQRFALARFSAAGVLEQVSPTFIVTTGANIVGDMLLLPDGRIIVAGWGGPGSDWILVRYLPSGFVDPSFGSGGSVVTQVGGTNGDLRAAALQPDGKILTAGAFSLDGVSAKFVVARFLAAGSLDPSFSGDGVTTTAFPGIAMAEAIVVQADGKIVAAGISSDATVGRTFALARYRPNGSLDMSFGRSGKTRSTIGSGSHAWDVGIGSGGRIVAAGGTALVTDDFALIGYLP